MRTSRRMAQASAAVVLLAAALMVAPHAASAQTCPLSYFQLGKFAYAPVATGATMLDSTVTGFSTGHITFNRMKGSLSVTANSGGRWYSAVHVVEHIDVAGVAAGTAVDAILEYRVDGWASQECYASGCGVMFEATLSTGGSSVKADATIPGPTVPTTRTIAQTLSLPVHFVAGSPIDAQFALDYGTGPGAGSEQADGSGTYRVTGLPAGVRAITCDGADLTGVTPTLRETWGKLKAHYR